ncbi:histidine kinase [Sulfolobus sp. A20]|uniref:CBS domain-containing protein n=1 Tax=Saccharolobus sp. A20 TaxID=1891280 RepID=UPI00084616BC|nr:CBS domain-containing protein [Sulfolobus sp. A20]TRM76352.1 CBS domain-containing protein [Sulfolobus sp. E5]TRM76456.1 CBS domain-containing protein [Sulfolobus sp. A20-N-F8]TRM76578.1 CBS domain-containing protein [Sulfolobus sp. B5]TRM86264.1 CBS domain-containing protein [Sulfolobus sp. A20-N-G8]TRM87088.1 CBS domain-containing protein [Sulfolobus sp. E3]TRM89794.1 CBS domain-containing protein [Sulfolobus sp. C3]TRN01220.1 CBS domain-containing protein [Sulfolobus sp. F1]TRN03493.1
MKEELVSDYMKTQVLTVDRNTSLKEIAIIMTKNNIGSVIVVDRDKPVGIITERDIVKAIGNGKDLSARAEEIMTTNLIMVRQDSPITGALSLMRSYNIRHLPVVDDQGNLKGIISIRDVARAIDDMIEG